MTSDLYQVGRPAADRLVRDRQFAAFCDALGQLDCGEYGAIEDAYAAEPWGTWAREGTSVTMLAASQGLVLDDRNGVRRQLAEVTGSEGPVAWAAEFAAMEIYAAAGAEGIGLKAFRFLPLFSFVNPAALAAASELSEMSKAGVTLDSTDGDHAFLTTADEKVAQQFGFEQE